jgi:16S rRNA (cytidine1402-2'-O)-methyltransferase
MAEKEAHRQEGGSDAHAESVLATGLYVVATPIGHLGDFSPRAQATLRAAAVVACEDTRTSGPLLAHFGIRTPLVALHAHNERSAADRLVARMRAGDAVALVSDAGTPAISDPGALLVAMTRAAGLPVFSVPGPSAVIAALSIAGLSGTSFAFAGFLPVKPTARRKLINAWATSGQPIVFYEAPHRLAQTLADLDAVLGGARRVFIARELTKRFEASLWLPLAECAAWLARDAHHSRGELVLILEAAPPEREESHWPQGEAILDALLEELPASQAARLAARISGAPRQALYQRALARKGAP